jgi:alkanesulfonate monooxygenase SsuD/methylene tetrahydromethanopterin reductase-like flavin-dependent oxidoreductase (luciferase family)
MTWFLTRFDFRAPGAGPAERQELFARALEQAAYADAHGQDALTLPEHHGAADGYLPSPLVVAAAMTAATRRVAIAVSALVVNFHDPIRLAEDIAVLDNLSGGRVSYTLGLGYLREEYELFGRPWETRGRDAEARIEVLLRAWTGEPVTFEGRSGRVTPLPVTRPHPMLCYGGGSAAAARRAARLGLHFQPQVADPGLADLYRSECQRLGREPGMVLVPPPGPVVVFCAEDPDRFWGTYGHHLLADAVGTESMHAGHASLVRDASTTVDELRAAGRYVVLTPAELEARCRSRELRVVTSHPMCAGLPAEPSWESLRLLGDVAAALARPSPPTPASPTPASPTPTPTSTASPARGA